jgi:hypothetical protein
VAIDASCKDTSQAKYDDSDSSYAIPASWATYKTCPRYTTALLQKTLAQQKPLHIDEPKRYNQVKR